MRYYTDAGPDRGALLFRHVPGAIDVYDARRIHPPIGTARCSGCNIGGAALWSLNVQGVAVPGRWVVIDREFVPAQ